MKILIGVFTLLLQQILVVQSQACGANSFSNACWSPCERTCKTRFNDGGVSCLAVCSFGCTCNKGYLKLEDGTCVPEDECPSPNTCPENEEYLECGSCDATCDTYNNTCISCLAVCTPGCYCKEGYVRSSTGSECVTVAQCEASKTCGANEIFDYCPSLCSEDCSASSETCTADAERFCSPSCRCEPGFYRSNGLCVAKALCPSNNNALPVRRSIHLFRIRD